MRHPDQEEGTIEEAVKEGFAACSSQRSVTQPDRTSKKDKKSPSGKAGSSTGIAASEKRTPEMAHIFAEVMTAGRERSSPETSSKDHRGINEASRRDHPATATPFELSK